MSPTAYILTVALTLLALVVSIFGVSWLNRRAAEHLIDQLEKRFDERFKAFDRRFNRVDQRLDRIERQLEAIFKPAPPISASESRRRLGQAFADIELDPNAADDVDSEWWTDTIKRARINKKMTSDLDDEP